jgi:DNA-binding response OmpR family regulator
MTPRIVVGAGGEIVIQLPQADRTAFQAILDRVSGALRTPEPKVDQIVLGAITVDFRRRRVESSGAPVHLTTQEFELLKYLAARPDTVVTRDELLRDVWKYPDTPLTRSVDNAIARLRKKIEPCPQNPMFILTAHRDGYCLASGPAECDDAALDHQSSSELR